MRDGGCDYVVVPLMQDLTRDGLPSRPTFSVSVVGGCTFILFGHRFDMMRCASVPRDRYAIEYAIEYAEEIAHE